MYESMINCAALPTILFYDHICYRHLIDSYNHDDLKRDIPDPVPGS